MDDQRHYDAQTNFGGFVGVAAGNRTQDGSDDVQYSQKPLEQEPSRGPGEVNPKREEDVQMPRDEDRIQGQPNQLLDTQAQLHADQTEQKQMQEGQTQIADEWVGEAKQAPRQLNHIAHELNRVSQNQTGFHQGQVEISEENLMIESELTIQARQMILNGEQMKTSGAQWIVHGNLLRMQGVQNAEQGGQMMMQGNLFGEHLAIQGEQMRVQGDQMVVHGEQWIQQGEQMRKDGGQMMIRLGVEGENTIVREDDESGGSISTPGNAVDRLALLDEGTFVPEGQVEVDQDKFQDRQKEPAETERGECQMTDGRQEQDDTEKLLAAAIHSGIDLGAARLPPPKRRHTNHFEDTIGSNRCSSSYQPTNRK
jgi:hypothetical protein